MLIKLFIKMLLWMFTQIFNSKYRPQIESMIHESYRTMVLEDSKSHEPTIMNLYRGMAKNNLILKSQIIKVKKGSRRYDLMIFETPKGVRKFKLKRHFDKDSILQEAV